MPIGSTCESICVNVDRKENSHGSSEGFKESGKGKEGRKSVGGGSGGQDKEGKGRGSPGRPKGPKGAKGAKASITYRYRDPDKRRAYMRVYMQKWRAK